MLKRIHISSGAVWEDKVGYSRAVRIGNIIEVSGTSAIEGEKVIGWYGRSLSSDKNNHRKN